MIHKCTHTDDRVVAPVVAFRPGPPGEARRERGPIGTAGELLEEIPGRDVGEEGHQAQDAVAPAGFGERRSLRNVVQLLVFEEADSLRHAVFGDGEILGGKDAVKRQPLIL